MERQIASTGGSHGYPSVKRSTMYFGAVSLGVESSRGGDHSTSKMMTKSIQIVGPIIGWRHKNGIKMIFCSSHTAFTIGQGRRSECSNLPLSNLIV